LATLVGARGSVVAVDLPGKRFSRLKDNLVRRPTLPVEALACDLLGAGAPPQPASHVLVDVPCSNSGVWGHKPDARWRVRPEDAEALGRVQGALLTAASRLVSGGGAVVYSTCSLDRSENEDRVRAWLGSTDGSHFRLEVERRVWAWEGGGDGAYAARLVRVSP
jgi:16S rRNA (cytosine967-C5)-methyltransferase